MSCKLTLFYCLLDLSCSECDVISLYFFCVALLTDLFVLCVACLTVLVNCLVKQFAMCLGVVAILLLYMCLVWVEALCWIDRVWSSTECACCACDPSVVPSLGFACVTFIFVLLLGVHPFLHHAF